MKLFKVLVRVFVSVLFASQVHAWCPSGWNYFQPSYVYSVTNNSWYYLNSSDTQWCYDYQDNQWREFKQSALATGWNYYQWPYAYSVLDGGWFYLNETDTLWCYSFNDQAWSKFGKPWWQTAQLDWKPFTALPVIDNPNNYAWSWNIQERSGNITPRFFAQCIFWNTPGKLLMADAAINPVFVEAATNLLFANATSTAMVKWNNPYDEFFIGTSSGIWRLDEVSNQLVNVWSWSWDPTTIVSLGNSIYGCVANFGSLSGTHLWTPSGRTQLTSAGGGTSIWADPVSGRYGQANKCVRVVATNLSIMIDVMASTTQYSLDGGLTFKSPVGVRSDGLALYVSDFYVYSGTNIIVEASYSSEHSLWIGPLGGTLYPLSFPTNNPIITMSTLFYSPSTRLLIAGDAHRTNLYSAVLPASE